MSILNKIFSVKENDYVKIITILGLKIKKRLRFKELTEVYYPMMFNNFQDIQLIKIETKNQDYIMSIKNKLNMLKYAPTYLMTAEDNYLNILLNKNEFQYNDKLEIDDVYLCWEIRPTKNAVKILNFAQNLNKPVLFIGDAFLRSADTFANKTTPLKYRKGISFTVDDLTSYFDATRQSRLEIMLNDKNLVITDEQKQRAKNCIDKIVKNHLSKYNHQPIFEPNIGRVGVKKVLVVDQSYNDMSILKGMANDKTFEYILDCAIRENPDADIIVKTHPDTMTGNAGGYYTKIQEHDNIYLQTTPINPISLIKYVDKVYVCTTQFGFEALMCGKEVHTFGLPFYANWGLTIDKQKCSRRTNRRTLEEVFYIAYILYSHYVNPSTKTSCEIEEAINYLLDLRTEYQNFTLNEKTKEVKNVGNQ